MKKLTVLIITLMLMIPTISFGQILTRTDEILDSAISTSAWDTMIVLPTADAFLFMADGSGDNGFTLRPGVRITDITVCSSAQVLISWQGTNISMNVKSGVFPDSTAQSVILAGGSQAWPWAVGGLGFRVTNKSGADATIGINIRGKSN